MAHSHRRRRGRRRGGIRRVRVGRFRLILPHAYAAKVLVGPSSDDQLTCHVIIATSSSQPAAEEVRRWYKMGRGGLTSRVRRDAKDDVSMPLKRLYELLRLEIPEVGLAVLGAGEDELGLADLPRVII